LGRPRKSLNSHALAGTRPQFVAQPAEPIAAGRPKFPNGLTKAARRKFKELCGQLAERGALTKGDKELLHLYATIYDDWQHAQLDIQQRGQVITFFALDKNGAQVERQKTNPYVAIKRDCVTKMLAILDRCGLTPIAKQKVHPAAAAPEKRKPIPGSMWDTHPELFDENGVYIPAEQRGARSN
jgi:P27 family predicted phage terminase small subunit